MASHYATMLETIRFHQTTAERLRAELDADVELLIQEGFLARPSDEDPIKALGKYLDKLPLGSTISAADVKSKVPATREHTHRAITAMLNWHPAVIDTGTKDQFGLKTFRRADLTIEQRAEAAE